MALSQEAVAAVDDPRLVGEVFDRHTLDQLDAQNAQPQTAVEQGQSGIGLQAPGEVQDTDQVNNPDRVLVRGALRFAEIADKAASKLTGFASRWSERRTARGVAKDVRESAADKVERGKQITRQVGNSVVNAAVLTGLAVKVNTRGSLDLGKEKATEQVGRVRGFVAQKAKAARGRKATLMANLHDRKDRTVEATRRGAETTRDRSLQAAKIGGNVLKVAGLVTIGAGVLAAEAGKKAVERGSEVVADTSVRTAIATQHLRAGRLETIARRGSLKAENAAARAAAMRIRASERADQLEARAQA